MEDPKEDQPDLTDQIKDYIETQLTLARYQAIDKGTNLFASLITDAFVFVCAVLTFLFASVTLALLFSSLLNSYWLGFGSVTLIYLLLAVVVSAIKTKYLQPRLINFLIKKIFNKDNGSSN